LLHFSRSTSQSIGSQLFLQRLDRRLAQQDATWRAQPPVDRQALLAVLAAQAQRLGFASERGVAAHVLAASWLGPGFEQRSLLLLALLKAPMPEVRKVHGLCEWVHDQLVPQATPASGDAVIRRSFALTEPWGRHGGQTARQTMRPR
jgi:hypothetical protein